VSVLIAILASVVLAAPFSTAEAAAVDDTDGLMVEITVEYASGAEAVIVRPFSEFEELPPTAMSDQGEGVWSALVRFPTAENWSVAFEAFPSDGGSVVSDNTTLLDMGVDPVVVRSDVQAPLPSDPLIPEGSWWLVVGIALAFAALIVLAFWTFGGRTDVRRTQDRGQGTDEKEPDQTGED
jgi:hypothetical protein